MTKPTSEAVQALKSEEALYNERLERLQVAIREASLALGNLRHQAEQTRDVINSLCAALDRLEKYEEEYPEDDEDDLPIGFESPLIPDGKIERHHRTDRPMVDLVRGLDL